MIHAALYAVLGAFLAALLRGFTGFGFVMAAVPLLSLALPPREVVPLAILLQIEVGLMDLPSAVRLCDWRALLWLVPGMVLGTPLGLLVLTSLSPNGARLMIGLLIAGSVAVLARGLRLPERPSRWLTLGVGMVSGTMNGMAGISGPPVVAYLLARPISTAAVRASAIVFFVMTASVALVPMAGKGMVTRVELIWSLAAVPALFLGARLGAWGFRRTTPRHHRATALIVLSVLAVSLIVRALAHA
jgi:uncharacterized protein